MCCQDVWSMKGVSQGVLAHWGDNHRKQIPSTAHDGLCISSNLCQLFWCLRPIRGRDRMGSKMGDSIQHVPFSLKYTPSSLILACYCPFSSEVPTSAALTGSAEQCCHACGTAGHSASDSTMLNGILAFVLPQQDWLIGLGHERIFNLLFLLWIMPSERQ